MRISYATESSPGRVNEDYALCGNDWAAVLDGATAFPGVESGCVHDVPWLVRHLAAGVSRRMLLDSMPLPDVLAGAIEETREAHGPACDLGNPDSPSSTISIVRVQDGAAEYLTLGDSPIVIRGEDQALMPVIDDRLAHLPGGRPYSRELVRSLRNQPGGFWVASTSTEAAYRAITGAAPFGPGAKIGIFTDGASRLVEFYGYEWEHVFSVMETGGPGALIDLVRAAERDRPLQGSKQHDDATVALVVGEGVASPVHGRVSRPAHWRDLVGL